MSTARIVLILGPHRSGTSAVAGSLHRCGLSFGDHLLPANEGNELGYFEDADIVRLNDELLAEFDRTWHDPRPLPAEWIDDPVARRIGDEVVKLLRQRLTVDRQLGLKDPRLCLLLPLYRRALRELEIDGCALLVVRNPLETIRSLARRDGFSSGKAGLLWLRDSLEAEAWSRDWPRHVVRFDALLEDWESELAPAFAAIEFEPAEPDWRTATAAGLRSGLRHHRDAGTPAHPWLAGANAALRVLRDRPDDGDSRRLLDELRDHLRLASPLFDESIADLAARLELAYTALRIETGSGQPPPSHEVVVRRLLSQTDARVDSLEASIRALEVERSKLHSERAAEQRRLESAEESVERERVERERLEVELRATRDEHAWIERAYRETRSSWSWRLTAPLRFTLAFVHRGTACCRRLLGMVTRHRVRLAWQLVRRGKAREAWLQARSVAHLELRSTRPAPGPGGFVPPAPRDRYELHCELDRPTHRRRRRLAERLDERVGELPTISVIMPVYEPPRRFLEAAVATVRDQIYGGWELVICDDSSPSSSVAPLLESIAATDQRIRIVRREQNGGIGAATNTAAEAATGDFLLFLDQDDALTPDALAEVALSACGPDVDLVYSDDDKIDAQGRRYAPQFKPDHSPELLLSFSYFSHVFAIRRALFTALGGVRSGFEGAQDYDLMLRAAERARRVQHVPKILYHWRAHEGSTATDGRAKPGSIDAGRRAVADAFARRGANVPIRVAPWAAAIGCGVYEPCFPDTGPRVAILIPSRDRVELLRRCVRSVERLTRYANYEIVLIENCSDEPETLRYFAQSPHRVLRIGNPHAGRDGFSYAAINNRAVEQVPTDLVLFLNNDTEVREAAWLSQMVGYLELDGVGAVGARLVLPDGRIQHAGIVMGLYERMAGPAFKLGPAWDGGHLSLARTARNCTALTAAALLVGRDTFLDLGGFDEEHFAVAYNDVDFCLRMRARGHRLVYCPGAELAHIEGGSRGNGGDHPGEDAMFRQRYWRERDPYYNPNLSLENERFELRAAALAEDPGRPVRAVMVGFNLNSEGSSNSQLELTVALRDRGVIDPVVYSPDDGPLRAEYERRGIDVIVAEHPLLNVHDPKFLERRLVEFAARLRELRAEVVYGNTLQTFFAILAAQRAGLPAIWNVRESESWRHYFDYLAPPLRPIALTAFEAAYAVVFVSGRTRDAYADLDSRHSFRLIRNGLDPTRAEQRLGGADRRMAREEFGFADADVVLLSLGTVCERKGQADAVAAFGKLPAGVAARCRLLFVGDRPSPYSDRLHAAIAALPALHRGRVRVEPERSDVAAPFAAADVFVFTSYFESYPRVILEAMYAGLPIVTTPVFGVTEQIRERVNALVFDAGDTDRLARHLATVAGDDPLRARMAANSPEVLRALPGFEQMVDGYADVFREAFWTGEDS